jgi:thiamine phosphate synthase YjbQ (UPF0047 family)
MRRGPFEGAVQSLDEGPRAARSRREHTGQHRRTISRFGLPRVRHRRRTFPIPRAARPNRRYAFFRMKSHTEYFTFETKKKRELVHLTPRLEEVLARAAVEEGFMLVSAMHITAGVSLLIHHEVIVPITKGRLDLGNWQRVFYAELDGQREKRLIVKVLGA